MLSINSLDVAILQGICTCKHFAHDNLIQFDLSIKKKECSLLSHGVIFILVPWKCIRKFGYEVLL